MPEDVDIYHSENSLDYLNIILHLNVLYQKRLFLLIELPNKTFLNSSTINMETDKEYSNHIISR